MKIRRQQSGENSRSPTRRFHPTAADGTRENGRTVRGRACVVYGRRCTEANGRREKSVLSWYFDGHREFGDGNGLGARLRPFVIHVRTPKRFFFRCPVTDRVPRHREPVRVRATTGDGGEETAGGRDVQAENGVQREDRRFPMIGARQRSSTDILLYLTLVIRHHRHSSPPCHP